MSDIVDRLREAVATGAPPHKVDVIELMDHAASEIERLRMELRASDAAGRSLQATIERLVKERKRL